jgi:hypothetical protein
MCEKPEPTMQEQQGLIVSGSKSSEAKRKQCTDKQSANEEVERHH